MGKYTGPKAKKCRRQGLNLYGADKYDRILQRKPQPPGKPSRYRPRRQSSYGKQLMEKQRARYMYGLSERQFHKLYQEASEASGQTGDLLKEYLERRLDNVIYRSGFARTRLQARQFVSHGLFYVNDIRVTIPSFRVQKGDVIIVRDRSKDSPIFPSIFAANEKVITPTWLTSDFTKMHIEIIDVPSPESAEQAMDVQQVIEFYSRI